MENGHTLSLAGEGSGVASSVLFLARCETSLIHDLQLEVLFVHHDVEGGVCAMLDEPGPVMLRAVIFFKRGLFTLLLDLFALSTWLVQAACCHVLGKRDVF